MALKEADLKILTDRGINPELLAALGVSSTERLGGSAIAIPYVENGVVINHKYRTIGGPKRFQQDAGARKTFYNVDCLSDPTLAPLPLVITEGEVDAWTAIDCGFPRTVSVPDGAPAEAIGEKETIKYTFLDNAPSSLRDVREIILAVDGDGPGSNLLQDLSLRLGRARCKFVTYPMSKIHGRRLKDLNEVLNEYGERGVVETLNRAQWMKVDGVFRMSELPPLPFAKPHVIRVPGFAGKYSARLGDFVVVTGIPGHGKSTVIDDICCHLAWDYEWGVAYASFEQRPQTDHRRNLRSWHARKRVIEMTTPELDAADLWIERNFSFIVPDEDDQVTLAWMLDKLASSVIRHGTKVAVVDPWNEMDHDRPRDMSLTEYVGFAIKEFKRLAKKLGIHLIIAAHPAKQRKLDTGEYSIPTLYDISDSANWYNKADVGIVVHRSASGTTIRIAKTKFHDDIGVPGDIMAEFDTSTRRYREIGYGSGRGDPDLYETREA